VAAELAEVVGRGEATVQALREERKRERAEALFLREERKALEEMHRSRRRAAGNSH
jgi:hypothetical protein